MAGNLSGISLYQQAAQATKTSSAASNSVKKSESKANEKVSSNRSSSSEVKVKEFSPLSSTSSLIPTTKAGYGTVIGDVELSDKAKDYYDKLKEKFHGMEFIVVSKDLKSEVAKNASAYGNATRQVVLIDEEKLERMATDESYRAKYEGIIAGSQEKLEAAKNSLISAGAVVKNFGMSINEDGSTSFFATIQKDFQKQNDALKARQKKHKAEKKAAEKKAAEKKAEKNAEKKRAEKSDASEIKKSDVDETSVENQDDIFAVDGKAYLNFESSSLEALVDKVSRYVFNASDNALSLGKGANIDFRG